MANNHFIGKPINYSSRIASDYNKKINVLIDEMVFRTEKEIKNLYKSDAASSHFSQDASISSAARILFNGLLKDFTVMFSSKSKSIAGGLFDDLEKWTNRSLAQSLSDRSKSIIFKPELKDPKLNEIRKASIGKNIDLIKTIPQDYLRKTKQIVFHSITTGQGLKEIQGHLEQQKDYTKRKAQLVALDQVRKITTTIAATKLKKHGSKKFKWLHTGGSQHPREEHIAMNNKIFSYDDPPVIDSKTGEIGLPAQTYNCRCRLCPVIEFK